MRGVSPASLMLPALLACFGQLVSAQVLPEESCPLPEPIKSPVLLPHPSDCSRYFSCNNGVPIEQHCPGLLHFNDESKDCDWPHNANCVTRKVFRFFQTLDVGQLLNTQDFPQESCPLPDPREFTVLLPHPSNCSSFFRCSNGVPVEQHCPGGLHFNRDLKDCDWPHKANCVKGCFPLQNDEAGIWTPSSCTEGFSNLGDTCKLQCNDDYQLRGSSYIHCMDRGWNSSNGDFIPKCKPEVCIGEDLNNDLNKTLSRKAGILFVLDESGSVNETNFIISKDFVKQVVATYPLSESRSAGVITFASTARVPIHLNVDSTSNFFDKVDKISYNRGGTDILEALQVAISEINNYSKHNLTVVVLVTDGMSSTDGNPAADIIKEAGHPIFTIGIDKETDLVHLETIASTGKDGIKHFFHIKSYEALKHIGEYLNPPAGSGGTTNNKKCFRVFAA